MTTTSSSASHAAPNPVVGAAPQMPKVKISSKAMAHINAFTIALSIFFGGSAIFAAIAGFTKGEWDFSVPFIGSFLGGNTYPGSSLFMTAFLVLALAIIGMLTLRKVTSLDDMKAAWKKVAAIFAVITAIFLVEVVATAIYSLCGVGQKSGVSQKYLWLSSFLPILINGLIAFGVTFMAKQIAAGKAQVLRIASYIALGVAALAFILVIVYTFVDFYSKKTYADYLGGDAADLLEGLEGLESLF